MIDVKTAIQSLVLVMVATLLAACGGGGGSSGTSPAPTPTFTVNNNSLSFGNQLQNTASAVQTVVITNSGTTALSISGVTVSGANASSFSETNTCSSVAVNATCSISVTFTPTITGNLSASLSIASNASSSPLSVSLSGKSYDNGLPVTVDTGPSGLTAPADPSLQASYSVNTLYATITVCTPGTNSCQAIDHVQIDTQSVGLRLMSSALTAVTPTAVKVGGNALFECSQFADGYTWGSVGALDVRLGGQTLSSVAVNVMGDAAAGTAPTDCSTPSGGSAGAGYPDESNVYSFGANGILGVGNFLQDCGSYCVSTVLPGSYYTCVAGACTGATVPLSSQLQNPVGLLNGNNTGVVVSLPAVTSTGVGNSPGANSLSGTLFFGVNTAPNNQVGTTHTIYNVNSSGELTSVFAGSTLSQSFIDSGSNAYFFNDPSINVCTDNQFFCPASTFSGSATITGANNGSTLTVPFLIDNADALFFDYTGTLIPYGPPVCTATGGCVGLANVLTALPTLGGPNGSTITNAFDWGLPFFFGRDVYVLFEPSTGTTNSTAPSIAF